MPIFSKAQVVAQGSLEDFAEWAGTTKVYRLANGSEFIAIRSQQEEYEMVLNPDTMTAVLIYSKGTYIPFDWESLSIEKIIGSGRTRDEAIQDARGKMKRDVMMIGDPRVITTGSEGVTEIEGLNEDDVKVNWIELCKTPQFNTFSLFSNALDGPNPNSKVRKVECIHPTQNSMFGLNKKPGVWKVYWINEWQVEITYR